KRQLAPAARAGGSTHSRGAGELRRASCGARGSLRGGASARRQPASPRGGALRTRDRPRSDGRPQARTRELGRAARGRGSPEPRSSGEGGRRRRRTARGRGMAAPQPPPGRRSDGVDGGAMRTLLALILLVFATASLAHKPSDSYLTLERDGTALR